MAGFNFGQIAPFLDIMDTDVIDIGRRGVVVDEGGFETEINPDVPLYTDVPCHLAHVSIDNPDTGTRDTIPIITTIRIHCPIDIDLQNDDFITAKKLDANGNVLATYKGVIGFPQVDQARQSAIMAMRINL